MNAKNIILFVSGVIVGGTAGVLGSKKYFQEKYKRYYEEDRELLERYYRNVNNIKNNKNNSSSEESNSRPNGRMSSEERKAVKEKIRENNNQKANYTDYTAMYDGGGRETIEISDPVELEHPEEDVVEKNCGNCGEYAEDDPENCSGYCDLCAMHVNAEDYCSDWKEKEEPIETSEEEAFNEHQNNMNKPPKIISAEAYGELPAYITQEVMYYYSHDGMVTDENDELVEEPELLIGDSLTKYGFVDSDEMIIFVMNYAIDTCFEIQKVDASWSDSH